MAINFSNTLTAIYADLDRNSVITPSIILVLLILWTIWLVSMPIPVYRLGTGYIGISQPPLAVVASSSGRLSRSGIQLGDRVLPGTPLFELDIEEDLRLIKKTKDVIEHHKKALQSQQEKYLSEIESLSISKSMLNTKIENLQQQLTTALDQHQYQLEMLSMLSDANAAISKIDLQRELMLLKQIKEKVTARELDLAIAESERQLLYEQGRLLQATLAQDRAHLLASISTLEGNLEEYNKALKQKIIISPIDAVVAEITSLQAGQWIETGQSLASLFPSGELEIIGFFKPADAQGHITHGQNAKIYMDSFPWLNYGRLNAEVTQIDRAERDGNIRIKLKLLPGSQNRLPLEPGMSLSIRVETDRKTPWALLLQSVGHSHKDRSGGGE